LPRRHRSEDAALGEKLIERALLDDPALRENEDVVHGAQRGEAMCNADHGAMLGEVIDRLGRANRTVLRKVLMDKPRA